MDDEARPRGAITQAVSPDEAGLRLDRWFRRRFPALGHAPLEKLLRTGQVRIDGKRVKANHRLAAGAVVRLPPQLQHLPPKPEAPASPPKESDARFVASLVLHADAEVFVLNKPSGLATQGGSGIRRHLDGLLGALQGTKRQKPKLVHRLDRGTSGVLLVARTQPAAAALAHALHRRDAEKVYWALTVGVPKLPRGVIRLALAKQAASGSRAERMEAVGADEEGAKTAITHYAVLGQAAGKYAWVAVKPVTGRTHQIRAHLAALGTSIVGDFKYGGAAARGLGALEDRLHLHARAIDVAHPGGGRLRVTAPLPPHMRKAWRLFGFDPDFKTDPFTAAPPGARR